MENYYDAIIIGAGAAGLMCAGVAGLRGRKVLLIEHSKKIGEKIRISGGGRCNFTNIFTTPKNFISQNEHFCVSALKRFGADDFIKMVQKHNISFHEKTLGQLFCDFSSKQIIDMLLDECHQGGVEIALETSVKKIAKNSAGFFVDILRNNQIENLSCKSLVVASGGLSIPKIGASSFGYELAKQFGLKIVKTRPALVPLTLKKEILDDLSELSGVSFDAKVSCDKISFREAVLITHRGLSGPAILQISSYLDSQKKYEIFIDALPDLDIYKIFLDEKKSHPRQEISTILAKYLPKRLANYFALKNNVAGFIAEMSNDKLQEIAKNIKAWRLDIAGDEGYAKAEVTAGGVDVDEISSKTFECKNVAGLYFIGEVLDVTGHLGGFNFQFAWSSGFIAGNYI